MLKGDPLDSNAEQGIDPSLASATCCTLLKKNTKFKFSTIVTRTDVITHGMLHRWFIASFGVLLDLHIEVLFVKVTVF
jgi:hypothetical protein